MEEVQIKSRVVGLDISNESTTYAIVDVRGNIIAESSFSTEDYPDINAFVTHYPYWNAVFCMLSFCHQTNIRS